MSSRYQQSIENEAVRVRNEIEAGKVRSIREQTAEMVKLRESIERLLSRLAGEEEA